MFKLKKENLYNFLLLLLSTSFLIYFYGAIIIAPNDILFCKYGDGFSQYYTFTYFIKHNPAYLEYLGSNYPYGEHIVYFDGQPFFAAIFKTLAYVCPFIKEYTIGILNYLALFSIWWTPFLLYGILLRLKVRPILAVLGAMGILFLNPQVFRLLAHFSLSYSCAIPLTIYLLIRVKEGINIRKWTIWLGISNLIWLYVHPYLGLCCCLLTGSIWFFHWIWKFKALTKCYGNFLFPFLSAGVPVLIFKLVIKLTDTHLAKTENVYGFFKYCGAPNTVFLPHHPPFKAIFQYFGNNPLEKNWEGWSYIGIISILTLSLAIIITFIRKLLKKKPILQESFQPIVWVAFIATVPLLLLSWAFPFLQYPELLDYFTGLKQFRSLGRFAWPFYYISTLCSIYFIHRATLVLELKNKRTIATLLMITAPLMYVVEGYMPHKEVSGKIKKTNNFFIEKYRPEILKEGFEKINPEKYQAILPLPFYYLGSGNYYRPAKGATMHMAMLTSAYTGLPTISTIMGRGDVWESRNLIQIISPPYYYKKIKEDIDSEKPILVTRSLSFEKLTPYEQKILDKCRLVAIDEFGTGFHELYLEDLFNDENNKVLSDFEKISPSLYKKNSWLLEDSSTSFIYEDFEDLKSSISFRGDGALSCFKKDTTIIKEFNPFNTNNSTSEKYNLSVWIYNGAMDAMNYFHIIAKGLRNGKKWDFLSSARPDEAITINGDWSLLEFNFTIPPDIYEKIQISCRGNKHFNTKTYIDDLLIYNKSKNIYKIVSKKDDQVKELIYNGHQIIRQD